MFSAIYIEFPSRPLASVFRVFSGIRFIADGVIIMEYMSILSCSIVVDLRTLTFGIYVQEEEERRHAKFQALQAAFPALAIGAGAVGALVGGNKHL